MKKIVLSMALCVVLFGAVTTVTGCGKKPRNDALLQVKGTVWEETVVPPPPPAPPTQPDPPYQQYYCFHSDGHLYMASNKDGDLKKKEDLGTYSVDSKNITTDKKSYTYELKGDEMSLKDNNTDTPNKTKKVSVPTEDKIKGLQDK
jgi:putative lipoprotein